MPKRETQVWEELYKAALVETDSEKLSKRIQAAKASIDSRIHETQSDHGGTPAERHAICDALAALNVLRRKLENTDRAKQRLNVLGSSSGRASFALPGAVPRANG
jgi:hypothetical protein